MSEQQAQEYMQQAEKKLNGWSFFGGNNKYEDAADLYAKAGNTFKLAQRLGRTHFDHNTRNISREVTIPKVHQVSQWKFGDYISTWTGILLESTDDRVDAGDAFMKAAELHKKVADARFEASRDYENASKCYKKSKPEGWWIHTFEDDMDFLLYGMNSDLLILAAVTAIKEAIAIDKEMANFRIAAKHHSEVAEIYENDLVDLPGALENWDNAAQLYLADDSPAMVSKCTLKAAHLAAVLGQYDNAIEKFESVAAASVDNQLTKWSVKEYFLKAGLCHLCTMDTVRVRQAIEKYCNMDVTFESTREHEFLQDIVECVENDEVDLFTQKVYAYDEKTKLDNWKTSILLKIKKSMGEEPSLM
ncbi:hypothetical protein INT43_001052 [Umbelopsis isabellina]|uniref:Alpha-soluble NSF attachment protein n=1 Tax=Mortierella isabellina TaxID=91625 RepID=A0A8H7PKI6_MORIS|nr:hypothetical protein INT43_001052 [Umbelopsis isabellina]